MAIISKPHNFIFTHIPKTAGNSIRTVLSKYKSTNIIEKPEYWHESTLETKQHIDEKSFNKMFKFAFIRNPWDRMYSTYNFLCHKTISSIERKRLPQEHYKTIGFKRWLLEESFYVPSNISPTPEMIPIQKKNLVDWICDKNGNQVVDYIGRFENLNEDFNYILSTLNLPIVTLPKIGPSKRNKSYKNEYDSEMNDYMYKYCVRDIEKFGYEY